MVEMYQDKAGEWRWRFRAKNGNVLADSGEGYKNKGDMLSAIMTLKAEFPGAELAEDFI